jgi:hypothetical protein
LPTWLLEPELLGVVATFDDVPDAVATFDDVTDVVATFDDVTDVGVGDDPSADDC